MLRRSIAIVVMCAILSPLAVSAASSNSCLVISRTLARGSKGPDVMLLQQYLVSQKLLAADGASGYFGAMTEAAVQKWQVIHGPVAQGTPATTGFGMVGAKTRSLLCTVTTVGAVTPPPPAPPTAQVTPPPVPPASPTVATAPVAPQGVGAPPTITSFLATPDLINAPGEQITLSWTAFTALACDIGYGDAILARAQQAIGAFNVSPTKPTTYTLTCKGLGDGTTSTPKTASTTRAVGVVNLLPTCTITLDKSSYKLGEMIRLTWKSEYADSASWKHNPNDPFPMPFGNANTSGMFFINVNSVASQGVTLTVVGKGGTAVCTATITTQA